MSAIIWPFLIYWVALFVACYTVCEVGQDQFYDEVTPGVGWKVAVGSFIFAALATWLKPSYESIFTSNIAFTLLQLIVWVLVFILVFQFHPPHALALAPITMVLVVGLATMGVESLTKAGPRVPTARAATNNVPLRGSLNGGAPPAATTAPAK